MKDIVNNKCIFFETKDSIVYKDPFINDYYNFLINHKSHRLRATTIDSKIRNIHKFWIFAIYFQPNITESLEEYISRYYKNCVSGYKIKKTINNDFLQTTYTYKKYRPSPNPSSTFHDLSEYFQYIYNKNTNIQYDLVISDTPHGLYLDQKDLKEFKNIEKHNKGSSYALRAKGLMANALLKRKDAFSEYKRYGTTSSHSTLNKTFPLQLFDNLIALTKNNPRRRLLYLLCGAYGARISQACSITIYDIDVKNRRVYLTNPRNNERPKHKGIVFLDQKGRYDILKDKKISTRRLNSETKKYELSIESLDFKDNPYLKDLCNFKQPIPSLKDKNRNLYCFDEYYEELFFETYEQLRKINDSAFPFVIQTRNNTIPDRKSLTNEIRRDFKKLNEPYPNFRLLDLPNKWHSLRHMYGSFMASIAYFEVDDKLTLELSDGKVLNSIAIWKSFTAAKMGHKRIGSVDIYFNPDELIFELALEIFEDKKKKLAQERNKRKQELVDFEKTHS
jgi:integrase